MSATDWTRQLRDRPIAARRSATVIVAVLLAVSVVLLTATRPAPTPPRPSPRRVVVRAGGASQPVGAGGAGAGRAVNAAPAARVAERFLRGYLAYLYGHAPAGALTAATPGFLRSLRDHPPLVAPAMRARYPRVLSLTPLPAPPVGVSALVNDGELASYRLALLLSREHGRLLVSAVKAGT